jgi:hypothetical protein
MTDLLAALRAARNRPPDAANEERPTAATEGLSGNAKTDGSMVAGAAKGGNPPAQLRALQGWLVWKFEQLPGEPKARKVPYYVRGGRRLGRQGAPRDREQLVTYDAARRDATARGFDGVGLAVLPDWNITALDFDHVVRDGAVVRDVLVAVAGTYAELSPSGKGVRAVVTGQLTDQKSNANPTRFGFEEFSTKGFVTFTGQALVDAPDTIAAPSAGLLALRAERFGDRTAGNDDAAPLGLTPDEISQCLDAIDPDSGYDDWLRVGMALHHETAGDGLDQWDTWSAGGGKYPGRDLLESKWDSFGRNGGGVVTAGTLKKMAGLSVGQTAAPTDFAVIPEPAAPVGGHFPIVSLADFVKSRKAAAWLIKGFLPHATLGVMYGAPGSGKSFLAFDVCAALGRGIEWNGQSTRRARVLYVVAEGANGFTYRVEAYCHQHGVDFADIDIEIMGGVTPNLVKPEEIARLIAELPARGRYDLLVLDTFAQMTPGANENSGEDMGLALSHCRKISKAAGDAMVLLVHHSGKDSSKGARGWSGILGACDVEIEVTRGGDDRCAQVTKMKDGQDGARFGFTLLTVVLGPDDDGDVTSCVVEYGTVKTGQGAKRRRSPTKLPGHVLSIAHDMAGLSADGKIHTGELIDACVAQIPFDPKAKKDRRRDNVVRAISDLGTTGYLLIGEGVVSIRRDAE